MHTHPELSAPRLKGKDVKTTRLSLLEKQGGLCAICGHPCSEDKAVLDHDHKGGHIRAVLHRGCNALLGKLENNAVRNGLKLDQLLDFIRGCSGYIALHQENQTGLLHPTHRTSEEKVARVKARAKRKREAAKKAKLESQ